ATVCATREATSSSSDTSQVTPSAVWLALVRPSVAARSAFSLMSASTTEAPASAKACAVASPMPELAPVTRATWPLKSYVGFMSALPAQLRFGSGPEQDFDRSPPVHGLVAGGCLLKGQFEVEDLARVDLAVPDQVDQLGQEPAHRGGTAVQVQMAEEQPIAGQLNPVGDADVADVAAGSGGADGLRHCLLRADR